MSMLNNPDHLLNLRIKGLDELVNIQKERIDSLREHIQDLKEDKEYLLRQVSFYSSRMDLGNGKTIPIPDYLKIHFVNSVNQQKGGPSC